MRQLRQTSDNFLKVEVVVLLQQDEAIGGAEAEVRLVRQHERRQQVDRF